MSTPDLLGGKVHAFVVLLEEQLPAAEGLALILNTTFRNMDVQATAHAYYDEFTQNEFVEGGVEYGVRIEASGISEEIWHEYLSAIMDSSFKLYGSVMLELG